MPLTMKELQGQIDKLRKDLREALRVHLVEHHKYAGDAVDAVLSKL